MESVEKVWHGGEAHNTRGEDGSLHEMTAKTQSKSAYRRARIVRAKVEASAAMRSSLATAFRVVRLRARFQMVGDLLEKPLDLGDTLIHVRVIQGGPGSWAAMAWAEKPEAHCNYSYSVSHARTTLYGFGRDA